MTTATAAEATATATRRADGDGVGAVSDGRGKVRYITDYTGSHIGRASYH